MSFGLVVGEGAGVNAKASRLQMPRLWELVELGNGVWYHRRTLTSPRHICVSAFALEVVTEVRP